MLYGDKPEPGEYEMLAKRTTPQVTPRIEDGPSPGPAGPSARFTDWPSVAQRRPLTFHKAKGRCKTMGEYSGHVPGLSLVDPVDWNVVGGHVTDASGSNTTVCKMDCQRFHFMSDCAILLSAQRLYDGRRPRNSRHNFCFQYPLNSIAMVELFRDWSGPNPAHTFLRYASDRDSERNRWYRQNFARAQPSWSRNPGLRLSAVGISDITDSVACRQRQVKRCSLPN